MLKALAPIAPEHLGQQLVRGRYVAGSILGRHVPGYLEEENSNTQSDTETFVALRAEICNWRWAGVPFYLRTGKRMPQKLSQIVIHFKAPPHYIFAPEQRQLIGNKLIIRLQPQEGISLLVMTRTGAWTGHAAAQWPAAAELLGNLQEPAHPRRLRASAAGSDEGQPEPLRAQGRNRIRRKWCDQLIDGWQRVGAPPKPYAAGSWGPAASIALISRDGRSWYDDL